MGIGDNLMASGMARGARDRGKRVAFGDGKTILWDHHSELVFRGNPNVAPPGSEGDSDLEWIKFYKGHRQYNTHDAANHRWIWNMDFKIQKGEVFLTDDERSLASKQGKGFVVIEPGVPQFKSVAPNKRWPAHRFKTLASMLTSAGYEVRQFSYPGASVVSEVKTIKTRNFRHALAILENAALYVGPEGGLHHGAAAVGTDAVVLFGGFIPPEVTGYPEHTNLTGGAKACGSLKPCRHCREAMTAITVGEVYKAAMNTLKRDG